MKAIDNYCHIEWAEQGKRDRKVVRRSNYRVTGKYPSWKMLRMMQWESTIERDAFYLFDGTPNIYRTAGHPTPLQCPSPFAVVL